MATKAELQEQLNELKSEHEFLILKINDYMINLVDEVCDEGKRHIQEFYEATGLDIPTKTYQLEIPMTQEIGGVFDTNDNEIDFELIEV